MVADVASCCARLAEACFQAFDFSLMLSCEVVNLSLEMLGVLILPLCHLLCMLNSNAGFRPNTYKS